MSTRVKSTPFARFFVAMLFIAPLAYIGASYMNGQDGLQNIKNLFTGEKTEVSKETIPNDETTYSMDQLKKDLELKNMQIEELSKENEAWKSKYEALEQQLKESGDTQ